MFPQTLALLCRTLVDAGIRTIAFRFDGSGDSGSVEELRLFTEPQLSLQHLMETLDITDADDAEHRSISPGEFAHVQDYPDSARAKRFLPLAPLMVKLMQLTEAGSGGKNVEMLEDLAYAALEAFNYQNDEGGYGIVGLDLLTGAFHIWGYERIHEVKMVTSHGTLTNFPAEQVTSGTPSFVSLVREALSSRPDASV